MSFNLYFPISTERLFIEPLKLEDYVFIQQLTNSAGWIRFIGQRNIKNAEQSKAYIQKIILSSDITYWVVKDLQSKAPLGIVTFIKRDYLEYYDIGFAFLPNFEKKGFAFESTQAVLNVITESKAHQIIQASTLSENKNSIALLKKLGFIFEKEIVSPTDQAKLQIYQKIFQISI